jgi:hypothetical protein
MHEEIIASLCSVSEILRRLIQAGHTNMFLHNFPKIICPHRITGIHIQDVLTEIPMNRTPIIKWRLSIFLNRSMLLFFCRYRSDPACLRCPRVDRLLDMYYHPVSRQTSD